MATFRRFDPYALLAENRKQPKTLAGLAGLAGGGLGTEYRADAPAEENHDRKGTAAKAAKPAKVFEPIPTPSRGEVEEERAAIVEHAGNIARAWAAGFARLHPDRPPGDVPPKRWVAFIDDIGRFLDSPFCAIAAALGWGPHDLFGCDRDRPFARIDQAGLLWLLNGDKLVALTENTARIARRTGARQTYRRKPSVPGRVLGWELSGDG